MSGRLRKADYPPNWSALRQTVLHRATFRCECTGACGTAHHEHARPGGRCRAPHRVAIVRDPVDPARWWTEEEAPLHVQDEHALVQVVLTIAHLCQDSTCADLSHLRAMCQRCHLRYDAHQHQKSAAATRRRSLEAAGQLGLL